ncbi:MAG: hypothetical protein ABI537_05160 [Casimicrobiaceae bacterium]
MQFYPTPLANSPIGAVEDKAVWLAKVQGLISRAPPLLQQSILASTNVNQFEANLSLLEELQEGSLKRGAMAVKAVAARNKITAKRVEPAGFGDSDSLVYTPLQPCRIMDTRSATAGSGVQGPILGNSVKSIPGTITTGTNWGAYGGNASSDCGLNSTVGDSIYAVAIVITVLNPNFDAYLGVGDTPSLPTVLANVALNFTHGQGLSTVYIVSQLNQSSISFAMPAGLSANIIFDVIGYFALSQATPLACNTAQILGTGTANVPANSGLAVTFPACASGYSRTGTGCFSSYSNSFYWLNDNSPVQGNCFWHNNTAGALDANHFRAEVICCKIPGR